MYYAPLSLDVDITTRCNLRCSYCSHFSSDGDVERDLPVDQWRDFFEECRAIGIMRICLCGGEAFFRPDIREIINAIVRNQMRFSVLSNGTLIDDDLASFLNRTERCNGVQVSIDGPDADTHDRFRGKGSFAKALNGLRALLRQKVKATVRVTLNRHNYRRFPETAKLLLEDLHLPDLSTNSVSYFGLSRENNDSLALNAVEFSEAMIIMLEMTKKYPGRINASAGPLACARMWRDMEAAVNGDAEVAQSIACGSLGSCGCVWSKLAVRADGMIAPCNQLSHMVMGRINQDGLRELWLKSPVLEQLRNRINIELSSFDSCRDCTYRAFCRGGCPATAYTTFGAVDVPNLAIDSCYRAFLTQGGSLPSNI